MAAGGWNPPKTASLILNSHLTKCEERFRISTGMSTTLPTEHCGAASDSACCLATMTGPSPLPSGRFLYSVSSKLREPYNVSEAPVFITGDGSGEASMGSSDETSKGLGTNLRRPQCTCAAGPLDGERTSEVGLFGELELDVPEGDAWLNLDVRFLLHVRRPEEGGAAGPDSASDTFAQSLKSSSSSLLFPPGVVGGITVLYRPPPLGDTLVVELFSTRSAISPTSFNRATRTDNSSAPAAGGEVSVDSCWSPAPSSAS
mmetsp:Transcript_2301/g.7053  ORF Transcript_2301/g.7053 Transcript_2301/m.7053 type:complete len:259 (+) Transcript_2301:1714-2490(+)